MRRSINARTACLAMALIGAALAGGSASGASLDTISTVAGNGNNGFSGDGNAATDAVLNGPGGIAAAANGSLLIADTSNDRVREVSGGQITTVAGGGTGGLLAGILAPDATLSRPTAVEPLAGGGFAIADSGNDRVAIVEGGVVSASLDTYDSGSWSSETFTDPHDVSVVPGVADRLLVADSGNDLIHEIDLSTLEVATVAGDGSSWGEDDGQGDALSDAKLENPSGVAAVDADSFLIADTQNDRILRVDAGQFSTVAGTGDNGFSGDGGPATEARLNSPSDVVPTTDGGFLFTDEDNHRVRYVSPGGVIDTVAGTEGGGYNGEGISARSAQLKDPGGVDLSDDGVAYVADSSNHRIRSFVPSLGEPVGGSGSDGADGASGSDGAPGEDKDSGDDHDNGSGNDRNDPGDGRLDREKSPAPADGPGSDDGDDDARDDDGLAPPAPPVVGERVNAAPVRGAVRIRTPNGRRFVALEHGAALPVGATVDARSGAVRITAARNARGKTQSAVFHGGTFKLRQRRARRPVTELLLRGRLRCGAAESSAPVSAAARRRSRRGLWGRGHGRFRTRGRHGTATVRGTVWHTADRCDGTLVRVRRGVVTVRDFARHRQVRVRAGGRYLARAPGRR